MRTTNIPNIISTPGAVSGHINIADNNGKIGKLYIEDSGMQDNSQGTLVCVPGMGETRKSYQFVIKAFISKGYRVVVSDVRGMGDSSKGFNDFSLEHVASDMREIVNQRKLTEDVILVGFSLNMGSVITLASELIPSVKGVLLLDPELRNIRDSSKIDVASISMSIESSGKPVWHIHSNSSRKCSRSSSFSSASTKSKDEFKKRSKVPSFGKLLKSSKQRVEIVLLRSISLF